MKTLKDKMRANRAESERMRPVIEAKIEEAEARRRMEEDNKFFAELYQRVDEKRQGRRV